LPGPGGRAPGPAAGGAAAVTGRAGAGAARLARTTQSEARLANAKVRCLSIQVIIGYAAARRPSRSRTGRGAPGRDRDGAALARRQSRWASRRLRRRPDPARDTAPRVPVVTVYAAQAAQGLILDRDAGLPVRRTSDRPGVHHNMTAEF
jgi:hypothetical protein